MEKIIKCCDGKAEVRQFKGTNSNMYIISYPDEKKSVLVDCGLPWDIPNLIKFIKEKDLPPVERVVCTHFHVDHCSGWVELKKVLHSPLIYFHIDAAPFVSGEKTMEIPALSDFKEIMIPVMKENQYMPELKETIKTLYYGTSFKSRFPMDRVIFFNLDDDIIPGFLTIHTPGHRPESVSFFDPSSGVFISGDFIIVMKGKIIVNTFVYDSHKQMESLEKIKKLEDLMYLLPGHGEIKDFNEKLLKYKI